MVAEANLVVIRGREDRALKVCLNEIKLLRKRLLLIKVKLRRAEKWTNCSLMESLRVKETSVEKMFSRSGSVLEKDF